MTFSANFARRARVCLNIIMKDPILWCQKSRVIVIDANSFRLNFRGWNYHRMPYPTGELSTNILTSSSMVITRVVGGHWPVNGASGNHVDDVITDTLVIHEHMKISPVHDACGVLAVRISRLQDHLSWVTFPTAVDCNSTLWPFESYHCFLAWSPATLGLYGHIIRKRFYQLSEWLLAGCRVGNSCTRYHMQRHLSRHGTNTAYVQCVNAFYTNEMKLIRDWHWLKCSSVKANVTKSAINLHAATRLITLFD
jgi:hypothetical protein